MSWINYHWSTHQKYESGFINLSKSIQWNFCIDSISITGGMLLWTSFDWWMFSGYYSHCGSARGYVKWFFFIFIFIVALICSILSILLLLLPDQISFLLETIMSASTTVTTSFSAVSSFSGKWILQTLFDLPYLRSALLLCAFSNLSWESEFWFFISLPPLIVVCGVLVSLGLLLLRQRAFFQSGIPMQWYHQCVFALLFTCSVPAFFLQPNLSVLPCCGWRSLFLFCWTCCWSQ